MLSSSLGSFEMVIGWSAWASVAVDVSVSLPWYELDSVMRFTLRPYGSSAVHFALALRVCSVHGQLVSGSVSVCSPKPNISVVLLPRYEIEETGR